MKKFLSWLKAVIIVIIVALLIGFGVFVSYKIYFAAHPNAPLWTWFLHGES
jgi:predicted negative regulator of RcsB-dependent stress response